MMDDFTKGMLIIIAALVVGNVVVYYWWYRIIRKIRKINSQKKD